MELQIKTVHQPDRTKLVFRELALQPTRDLPAKLFDAFLDQRMVVFVVLVHPLNDAP